MGDKCERCGREGELAFCLKCGYEMSGLAFDGVRQLPEVRALVEDASLERLCKHCWVMGEFGSCEQEHDCEQLSSRKSALAPFAVHPVQDGEEADDGDA